MGSNHTPVLDPPDYSLVTQCLSNPERFQMVGIGSSMEVRLLNPQYVCKIWRRPPRDWRAVVQTVRVLALSELSHFLPPTYFYQSDNDQPPAWVMAKLNVREVLPEHEKSLLLRELRRLGFYLDDALQSAYWGKQGVVYDLSDLRRETK